MARLFERAAVIGVGLIGGSFAAAARRRGLVGEVVGVGRSEANLATARERDLVDRATSELDEIGEVDLVLLAVPVRSNAAIVERLAPGLRPGTVVTDAGSTKKSVVADVESRLPEHCPFVGAHPIAGSEQAGAAAAREDLFEDSVCVLTPGERSDRAAVDRIADLWRGLGARVVEMSPAAHDRALAWTSHLGHVVSYALARAVAEADSEDELMQLVGPGLRDLTRLAGGSTPMWRDIFLANREEVLSSIDDLGGALRDLRQAIDAGDAAALDQLLAAGLAARRKIGGGG